MNRIAYIFLPVGAACGATAGGSRTSEGVQSPYIDSALNILSTIRNLVVAGSVRNFGCAVQNPMLSRAPLDFTAPDLKKIAGDQLDIHELSLLKSDKSFRSFCSFIENRPYRELLRIRVVLEESLSGNEFIVNIAQALPPNISYFIKII